MPLANPTRLRVDGLARAEAPSKAEAAARLLLQATFGPTVAEVHATVAGQPGATTKKKVTHSLGVAVSILADRVVVSQKEAATFAKNAGRRLLHVCPPVAK